MLGRPEDAAYPKVLGEVRDADIVIGPDDKIQKNRFGPEGRGAFLNEIEQSRLVTV